MSEPTIEELREAIIVLNNELDFYYAGDNCPVIGEKGYPNKNCECCASIHVALRVECGVGHVCENPQYSCADCGKRLCDRCMIWLDEAGECCFVDAMKRGETT